MSRIGRTVLAHGAAMLGTLVAGRDGGGERPHPRASTALALSVIALLACALQGALSAGVAWAGAPSLVSYGQFSTSATPVGVAVDQSSGDVYVANMFAGNVNKFDATGKLLAPPSPFGKALYSGAAVNPTNGDVYVLGNFPTAIDTFDPATGAPVGTPFPVPASSNSAYGLTVVQIATDSAGDVYVPVAPSNEVLEYSPSGTLLKTFTGSGAGALSGPTGVAIDSSGNVWVTDNGNNRIEELSPADTPVAGGEIKSEGVLAVALDGKGDVLAIVKNSADSCGAFESPCQHFVEYSSAGVQLADFGAGLLGPIVGTVGFGSMVAVNDSSGRVYVTVTDSAGNGSVLIFGPPTAPVIGRELAAEVGISEAKLGALVNPGGAETSYRFEYDTREYREGEAPHGQSTPFPEGSVGNGVSSRTVWAAASDLAPGTTYHYRVIAINALRTAYGSDQTFTTLTEKEAECKANEPLRGGFAARLPDCRAYELVTPSSKLSTEPEGGWPAARDGDALAFRSAEPLPGSPTGGYDYVATRGADGWSAEEMIPLRDYTSVGCGEESGRVEGWSADISSVVVLDGESSRSSGGKGAVRGECDAEGVETVSGEPVGYENLLLRDNATGVYRLINLTPPGVTPADARFQGASVDLSRVVFSEHAQLTPNAPGGVEDLYEWDEGALRLVTVLPGGVPVVGSLVSAPVQVRPQRAVSADGSHIFFTAGGALYVRVNGQSTVQVDASQAGGSGGGGKFMGASVDGSRVLFTDEASAGLTTDTVQGSGVNLYEYNLESGVLKDLTATGKAGVHGVVGISEDGAYVYFLAEGNLAAGAVEGQPNLYLAHGGSIALIATLAGEEAFQASPDGAWFAFVSKKSLTGYDNTRPNGAPANEIFLYNATSSQLVCASCNPSGEAPTSAGGATMRTGLYVPHSVSDSGRLFFETGESLVPSDTNSQTDVYEYESGGLHLISSGTSPNESRLLDASESGDDVFFSSRQALVPQDTQEGVLVIYDARVEGGFPFASSPPPCTTADSCRSASAPQPSIYGAPSSQTFSGAGNLAPSEAGAKSKVRAKPVKCRKGFVKKRGKCVKKPKKKARKSAHINKRGK